MARNSGAEEGGEPHATKEQDEEQALVEAVRTFQAGAARPTDLPEHLRHLPERERAQELAVKRQFADQEYELRQTYASWILRILGVQLLITDVVFVVFAQVGEHWRLSSGVIEVWLAATVVQVVGIVLVVTHNLFPNRDREHRPT